MNITWVIGSNGLLGAALCRVLRSRGMKLYIPSERFSWHDESVLERQVGKSVGQFSAQASTARRWEIYWAAGVCTMGSAEPALARETRALSLVLDAVGADGVLKTVPGAIAFASSAGGIYAGSTDRVVNEHTTPTPTTAYAREKLWQEDLIRSFVRANGRAAALIARLSTLYGPGQSRGKPQGLIAHIARCMLKNQPVQIYVPFDTIRDYITADDAAAVMVPALAAIDSPDFVTRIIASQQPTTIAEIIGLFTRITRRTPRIVTSASTMTALYPRRVLFRSILRSLPTRRTSLHVGIAGVMAAERAALAAPTPEA